jgi:general secretion pathway protein H
MVLTHCLTQATHRLLGRLGLPELLGRVRHLGPTTRAASIQRRGLHCVSSARPNPLSHQHPHGFTLIEILIVMTIVGIATGVVVWSLREDPQRTLNREAEHLAAVFSASRDHARAQSTPLQWVADNKGITVSGIWPVGIATERYEWLYASEPGGVTLIPSQGIFSAEPVQGVNRIQISLHSASAQTLGSGPSSPASANPSVWLISDGVAPYQLMTQPAF